MTVGYFAGNANRKVKLNAEGLTFPLRTTVLFQGDPGTNHITYVDLTFDRRQA